MKKCKPLSSIVVGLALLLLLSILYAGCDIAQEIPTATPTNPPLPPTPWRVPTPISDYISFVSPGPDETLTRSTWAEYPGGICIRIFLEPLLRPGDNVTRWRNISLTLDDELVEMPPSTYEWEDYIVRGVDSVGVFSNHICWQIDLETGSHEAAVDIWTSTNEHFEYSWKFAITE
jgi:hypothetical protein